jgi:ATPase subunit of ABC transporter with duplicated ATPase domains
MLTVSQISKRYGDQVILSNVSLVVNPGERVGLIGPNGCGKTTLLRIVAGEETPSGGGVSFTPSDLRVGYLPQGLEPPPDQTVRDLLYPEARRLAELEALGHRLAETPTAPDVIAAYDRTLGQIERLGALYVPEQSTAILAGLGLDGLDLDGPLGFLSGGQKTRLGLARLLLAGPQLLLLDEPTNHLDITALEWLEDWLAAFSGAALIVSHDRTFSTGR